MIAEMSAVERNEAAFNAVAAKPGRTLHQGLRRTCPAAVGGEGGLVIDGGSDDDDAGAPKPTPSTAGVVAAALGVTVEQAMALLGSEPLEAAREISSSRGSIGIAPRPVEVELPAEDRQGRWLFEDRFNLDQMSCNPVNGDVRTYNAKGDKEAVWVAGPGKGDDGKRFCSLQICIRAKNGDPSKLIHGQPKPEVCLRGQGKVTSAAERAAWNTSVHVRFQPKAWCDDEA